MGFGSELSSREVQYLETQEKLVADSITVQGRLMGLTWVSSPLVLNKHHLGFEGKFWGAGTHLPGQSEVKHFTRT